MRAISLCYTEWRIRPPVVFCECYVITIGVLMDMALGLLTMDIPSRQHHAARGLSLPLQREITGCQGVALCFGKQLDIIIANSKRQLEALQRISFRSECYEGVN